MSIRALRILPPLAFARLGSAEVPLDNYSMQEDPEHPLGYRRIVPERTLVVDDETGAISAVHTPELIEFKTDGRIRPVAPFLELFAQLDDDTEWQPLTLDILSRHGLSPADVKWKVTVGNRKVERRTGDPKDRVIATTTTFHDHDVYQLYGYCENFLDRAEGDEHAKHINFGNVRYIRPTAEFPEIRFRFTPAKGLIYGPHLSDAQIEQLRADVTAAGSEYRHLYHVPHAQQVYDTTKGHWYRFEGAADVDNPAPGADGAFTNETLPPSLFSIIPPAPVWLNNNIAISRGYFDDACDGVVEVQLATAPDAEPLVAAARISAGPPALVPDSLSVRTLGDDLDQLIFGPDVPADESPAETRARAEDIVLRAFETVRFLNVAVMNGNPVNARDPLDIDTMPAEEAFDVLRPMRPVFSERTADTLAIMRLHQQVYTALRGGAAPWFPPLLRQPDQVADFTDHGRRKMPALMCGADGNYLALTHRQIATITKAASQPLDMPVGSHIDVEADPTATAGGLRPRNQSARRHAELHHVADGNPVSTRPVTSVGNCTPGLEVDFRAVWRRVFKGLEMREWDNLVVNVTDPALAHLKGCRLLRVHYAHGTDHAVERSFLTMAQAIGPSPANTVEQSVVYATDANPTGLVPLEWSNSLARMMHERAGHTVIGEFSAEPALFGQVPYDAATPEQYQSVELEVQPVFEDDTAVISRVLAEPGELTQGLCSPWQNDYRECSCYYWASARPDFVNVEPTSAGDSAGDNWLQKERTGEYVPDDYVDSRLVLYDDLFYHWEKWLRFAIRGQDAERSAGD
jgi:hypothetical protein